MIDSRAAVEAAYQRVLAYLESEEALQGHRLAYQHVAAVRQLRDAHLAELREREEVEATPIFARVEEVAEVRVAPELESSEPSPSPSPYPYRRGGRRRTGRG